MSAGPWRAALLAEWRKVVSTRMWWLLGLVLGGYMVFMGVVMGFSLTTDPSSMSGSLGSGATLDGRQIAQTVYTLAVSVGYVFPLLIGALSMTDRQMASTVRVSRGSMTPSSYSIPLRKNGSDCSSTDCSTKARMPASPSSSYA